MIRKTRFARAFLEAGLPTWVLLVLLMFIGRSQLGLSGFLVMLFPGMWGALRLREPSGQRLQRIGYYLGFSLAEGASMTVTLFATATIVSSLGLASGKNNTGSELVIFALLFVMLPVITFAVVRGAMVLPDAVGGLRWRGVLVCAAIVIFPLIVLSAGYWLMSQPYTGHPSSFEPRVATASIISNLDSADGWQVADQSINLRAENSALHFTYLVVPTWFYTVTWQIQPGTLPRADGLRLRARSDAATTLFAELEEVGGSKYRAWADFPANDWKTLVFHDWVPSFQAMDMNDTPDWEQVERITFEVYVETSGSNLWFDKIETATLDHTGEAPWLVAKSEHFWFRFHPSDQNVLADVQKSAEDQFARLTAVLGYQPAGRIPITIVSSHAELEEHMASAKPAWSIANAFPDSLDILTPRLYSPLFNNHDYADIFELLPHEVTHLLMVQIVRYPGWKEMPMWLNEGLATYLSAQDADQRALDERGLRDAAKQGRLPSLQALEEPFRNQAQPNISYAMAKSITGYLIETYGADKISPLLRQLASGVKFDVALWQLAGIDRETLERQWRERLVGNN